MRVGSLVASLCSWRMVGAEFPFVLKDEVLERLLNLGEALTLRFVPGLVHPTKGEDESEQSNDHH